VRLVTVRRGGDCGRTLVVPGVLGGFDFRAAHSCYNSIRALRQCRRVQLQVVRYRDGEVARLGILEGEIVRAAGGELFGELLPREHIGRLADLDLLPPVVPGKIVAIGLNYADHVAEGVVPGADATPDEPIIFLKPPSSLIGHGGAIVIPPGADPVHEEAELAT
jgi:2-keto-4-pentenoate hydratase/2-oxohepta-3-ene-1,7-dioic acid hydratase in catechol pathway